MSGGSVNLGSANIRVSVDGAQRARTDIHSLGGAMDHLGVRIFGLRAILNSLILVVRNFLGPLALLNYALTAMQWVFRGTAEETERAAENMKRFRDISSNVFAIVDKWDQRKLNAADRLTLEIDKYEREINRIFKDAIYENEKLDLVGLRRARNAIENARGVIEEMRAEEAEAARRREQDEVRRLRIENEIKEEALSDDEERINRRLARELDAVRKLARESEGEKRKEYERRMALLQREAERELMAISDAAEARKRADEERARREDERQREQTERFRASIADTQRQLADAQRDVSARMMRDQTFAIERMVEAIERLVSVQRR